MKARLPFGSPLALACSAALFLAAAFAAAEEPAGPTNPVIIDPTKQDSSDQVKQKIEDAQKHPRAPEASKDRTATEVQPSSTPPASADQPKAAAENPGLRDEPRADPTPRAAPFQVKPSQGGADPEPDPLPPVLIGKYQHAYYKLGEPPKAQEEELKPLLGQPAGLRRAAYQSPRPGIATTAGGDGVRFFAGRFTLAIKPGSNTLPVDRVYDLLNRKANEARRIAEWNNLSLEPSGLLEKPQIDLKDWVILGATCPVHNEVHWLAYGFHDTRQGFEIYSNSLGDVRDHPAARGWQRGGHPRNRYWFAPVDEGGWVRESFEDRTTIPAAPTSCGLRLQLTLARRQANIAFTFQGPAVFVVALGESPNPELDHGRDDEGQPGASEPLRCYAVVATLLPTRLGQDLDEPHWIGAFRDTVFGGEAAEFGRDVTRAGVAGLRMPRKLRSVRLPPGKALILGVYNPVREENLSLVAWHDAAGALQVRPYRSLLDLPPQTLPVGPGLEPSYVLSSGGYDVRVHVGPEPGNPSGVEFYFSSPR